MKRIIHYLAIGIQLYGGLLLAGNPDRAGSNGANQTLLNPFGRSAAQMNANTASLRGVEAMQFNVGGLAYVTATEFSLNRMVYLQGTDIFVNNLSFGQHLGNGNVIGVSVTSLQLGDIRIRTEQQPDGTLGTFTPVVLNLGFAYAYKFSNSITAGTVIRLISEGVQDARATGIGFDFGVQYQTAINIKDKVKKEDFRFGIGVRNIGPDMRYSGSGLSFTARNSDEAERKAYYQSENFNLPALLHIGASYDIRLDKSADTYYHKLTMSGNFNYNAFSNNILALGAEYTYKETFMLRGGYGIQPDINNENFQTQYLGYSGGLGMLLPLNKSGLKLGIDYAYAPTRMFNGMHNIGLRILFGKIED